MAQDFGPGRDLELTKENVEKAFEAHNSPVMTIGDIAQYVGPVRQTVHRVLVEEGKAKEWGLESGKVGNATAYWFPETVTARQLPLGSIPAVLLTALATTAIALTVLGPAGRIAWYIILAVFGLILASNVLAYHLTGKLIEWRRELARPVLRREAVQ